MSNQLDVEYDTEFFDALLSDPDSFTTAASAQSSPEPGTSVEGSTASPCVPLPIFSRYFMIGGSLFTRRRRPASGKAYHARFLGAGFAWTGYGSIFCPFTRQFVSLRSPHWMHLERAGFGMDTRLRYGRRVALVRPVWLQRTALSLQREGTAAGAHLWSLSLRQSLGALLETTPASDSFALAGRVREVLREESCNRTGRRIPLGFFDFATGESRSFAWGKIPQTNCVSGNGDVDDAMEFGEMFLRQALAWRTCVLQTRPKAPRPPQPFALPLRVPHTRSPTQESSAVSDLIAKYAALHAMRFVVPGQRMAYLSLPCEGAAAMPSVVDAALRACESPSATLLYCPIQHGIDYSTVADLRVFAVRRTGAALDAAMEWRGPGMCVLDVGMPGTPEECVVVVENAHLLSCRAIARLLDQWTRNGAAREAAKGSAETKGGARALEESKAKSPSERRRRPLLLSDAEVICAGMPLFGDTRAVFIGHARADSLYTDAIADNTSAALAVWQSPCGTVAVMAPAAESVVSLEESVVAAIRRAAPLFGRMPCADQHSFLALLCAAAGEGTGDTQDASSDEDELLRRHAWFDSLLRTAGKGGVLDCEVTLAQSPSLAAMRICHALLREYPVVHCAAAGVPDTPQNLLRGAADCTWSPPHTAAPVALRLFDSRHAAGEWAGAAHETLRREAALAPPPHRTPPPCVVAAKTEYVYEAFLEPPVLLGRWTRTFLFCAPVLADVLLLRRALLDDATARLAAPIEFLDADVFHIDYIAFPAERRCRLFGVRLRYATGDRLVADAALRDALATHMRICRFFPIWPPPSVMRETHVTGQTTVDETESAAALPSGIERRLFACAAAQWPPLRLTVASRVIALRPLSHTITRGTVCRVVRFAPIESISNAPLAHVYAAQQHHGTELHGANALPVVQADGSDGTAETTVLPAALLIGGTRALHHYALPALQLPLLAPCEGAAASTLFHPLFAHEDALMEFAATETRAAAVERLLRSAANDGFAAHTFVEDTVLEGNALHAESQAKLPGRAGMPITTAVPSRLVHCEALSALSLFPRWD